MSTQEAAVIALKMCKKSVHGENDVTSHAPGNHFNGGCIAK